MAAATFLETLDRRVLVYDGATGTWLQGHDLSAEDFGGATLEGCNENLVLTRPELITQMHSEYLAAGADIVETNTFGAFAVPLSEYGIADQVHEINLRAAQLANNAAEEFATADRPRFVAGSIGPGTKFATLGQISYATLRDMYAEQARGLLAGGVDLFIIETQFDLLGVKAAMNGCRIAMRDADRVVPMQVQVTIETTGRMLPGTEISAALVAIDAMRPDVIGINCATGPVEMSEHIRHLYQHSRVPISVLPNAGLPTVVDNKMHYDLGAAEFASHLSRFISEYGVTVVGGCCGTTPAYIEALSEVATRVEPAPRKRQFEHGATSIYSLVPFDSDQPNQATSFLNIGERTNANGSKQFREAMLDTDWDTCVAMAKDQIKQGAHILDVCVDYVGRDGALDMNEIAQRFATQSTAPLVLDSTEPPVMEAGLQWIGGRAILNSANLEDGEHEGSRLDRVMTLAREYGAAVICLLIDEEGQARDVEWKMRIAHRITDIAVNRYGLEPQDLIFDALTFPLSTGDEDLRGDAMATIEAIRRIKAELPGAHTTLGVSNVSFGLKPAARHVLNSVFLAECISAGLDSAIVHASKILPLAKIETAQRDVCLDLIYDRRGAAGALSEGESSYDPLAKLLDIFADVKSVKTAKADTSDWPVDRRLSQRIIDGDRDGLERDLDEAMASGLDALTIINDVLLSGMKVVGELFATGEMQLPFVLQSAETMKMSVAYLEPHMTKEEGDSGKGRIVLATVKGDVHDIGKNLVDIILTNNGYEVHNLGIKISIAEMIDKAQEIKADAIGMSGLLVKSTLIMRDNLEELNQRGLANTPVLLGGAALTRSYVERDLREVYDGRLFYGKDAFEGLAVMDRLGKIRRGEDTDADWGVVPEGRVIPGLAERLEGRGKASSGPERQERSADVAADNEVFKPPFVGSRVVKGLSIDEIATFINETTLFRNQWQFRPEKLADGSTESDEQFKTRVRSTLREQLAYARSEDLLVPQVVYGYYPANSQGNELIIWADDARQEELTRFRFPRQSDGQHLCIADFFRPFNGGDSEADTAAFQIVTMGRRISERTAELFAANEYTDYLKLHGLGVEMAEALAEMWHMRIRTELGYVDEDGPSLGRPIPPEVSGWALLLGLPRVPRPGGQRPGRQVAGRRPPRHRMRRGHRLAISP
jgi:5-methyltetrahydrofolate--homocysteine methyltransferase